MLKNSKGCAMIEKKTASVGVLAFLGVMNLLSERMSHTKLGFVVTIHGNVARNRNAIVTI